MSGELVVIGDRILISPDTGKERTQGGLYLPQGVASKEKVQTGLVVKVGPGYVVPHTDVSEPWKADKVEPKYIPLQIRVGDYAIFMRRESIEIEYDDKKFLIVPQSGVLAVVRDQLGLDTP